MYACNFAVRSDIVRVGMLLLLEDFDGAGIVWGQLRVRGLLMRRPGVTVNEAAANSVVALDGDGYTQSGYVAGQTGAGNGQVGVVITCYQQPWWGCGVRIRLNVRSQQAGYGGTTVWRPGHEGNDSCGHHG